VSKQEIFGQERPGASRFDDQPGQAADEVEQEQDDVLQGGSMGLGTADAKLAPNVATELGIRHPHGVQSGD
jgi:hypothetical protein